MMRGIIDGHVHLMPGWLVGTTQERIGVDFLPFGKLRLPNGDVIQIMPETIKNSDFSAEKMLALMDTYGVEKAVVLASSLTALQENIRAVQMYPDRFAAAMTLDQDDGILEQLEGYFKQGLTVIKFEMSRNLGYTNPNLYPDFKLDDPRMEKVYAKAAEYGVTIAVDPSPIGAVGYQAEALHRMATKYPKTNFVICHLGYPAVPMEEGSEQWQSWTRMTELARYENVWFDLAALSDFYRAEGCPSPTALAMVRGFMDKYGADKVIWGSDAPGTTCAFTYQQIMDMFLQSPLFTDTEKQLMFAENAKKAYHL